MTICTFYKEDVNDISIIKKYQEFYRLVPLYENLKGLKYPEIKLNKDTNLQINHPLKITCSFEGLVTMNTSFQDYFVYSWKSKDFYFKGMLMSLRFDKNGILFRCEKFKKEYMPRLIFEYSYSDIMGLKTYISNQGKF